MATLFHFFAWIWLSISMLLPGSEIFGVGEASVAEVQCEFQPNELKSQENARLIHNRGPP